MSRRNPIVTLMRLRDIRVNQAAARLAASRMSERQMLDELAARRRAHEQHLEPRGELTAAQMRVLSLQGIRSLELVAEAAIAVEKEQALVEEARKQWELARRELKSVERLDDRRRIEVALGARKASDRALDEIVVTRRPRRVEP
jgi:flagellar export protein FliJ